MSLIDDYGGYDGLGLAALVRNGEVSALELLDAFLARAEAAQARVNCFTHTFADQARKEIAAGLPEGPFTGVPFATKDLSVMVAGLPLTDGSLAWRGRVATQDSEIVRRMRAAGLVIAAQTTSAEYGLTTSTESKAYGVTRNPWGLDRTAGGSSGGAAAAVAAQALPMAQASDGGGSIRIPAACCGLFGMKPSRGRTPLGPAATEGWNGLTSVHAVTRSVRDSAALLDAFSGRETGARSLPPPAADSYLGEAARDPARLRIAVWRDGVTTGGPLGPEALASIEHAARLLAELGHEVIDAQPAFDAPALVRAMRTVVAAHAARWAGAREAELGRPLDAGELEPVTRRMVALGAVIPAVKLVEADRAFMAAAVTYDRFLLDHGVDVVLTSTLGSAPVELGLLSLDPPDMDAYGEALIAFAPSCPLFNQTGAPAMSVPLWWSETGLPLGTMFGARLGREDVLFRLAGQLERAQPWFDRTAPLA